MYCFLSDEDLVTFVYSISYALFSSGLSYAHKDLLYPQMYQFAFKALGRPQGRFILYIRAESLSDYPLGTLWAHRSPELLPTVNTRGVRWHLPLSPCSCVRPLVQAYTSLPILRLLPRVNLGAYC